MLRALGQPHYAVVHLTVASPACRTAPGTAARAGRPAGPVQRRQMR